MTCGVLVAAGIALTVSPVVYQTLERAQFFKVGLTLVFLAVAIVMAIGPSAWAELPAMITQFGRLPDTNILPVSLVLSGLVFAGAGGVNNLAQSNWIRDKGFGMGVYVPRIVSPITGEEVAAPATGSMLHQDPENLRRFQGWWAWRTRNSSCRSGSSASSRSRSSRRWPMPRSTDSRLPKGPTSASSWPKAGRSRRRWPPGSARSSGSSARSR